VRNTRSLRPRACAPARLQQIGRDMLDAELCQRVRSTFLAALGVKNQWLPRSV
jgi:hypothetical protein